VPLDKVAHLRGRRGDDDAVTVGVARAQPLDEVLRETGVSPGGFARDWNGKCDERCETDEEATSEKKTH
jgi:hypothetical protein